MRGSTVLTRNLLESAEGVVDAIDQTGYIPSEIVVDKLTMSPEDYLATICSLLGTEHRKVKQISVKRGRLTESKHVNRKALTKACEWIMLPEQFKAPRLLEQIIMQTWTLKPAVVSN